MPMLLVPRNVIILLLCILSSLCCSVSGQGPAKLDKLIASEQQLPGMDARIRISWKSQDSDKHATGTVHVRKPNRAVIMLSADAPLQALVSDGINRYQSVDGKTFSKDAIDTRGMKIDSPWWVMPIRFFFTGSINPFGAMPDKTARIEEQRGDGQEPVGSDIFIVRGKQPMPYTARLTFNSSHVLQKSVVMFGPESSPSSTFSAELIEIDTHPKFRQKDFLFRLPVGASMKTETIADTMIPIGNRVPDFVLPSKDGSNVSLRNARKTSKATLINFWYVHCAPCLIEFPEFEQFYKRFHAQGLDVIAINQGDGAQAVSEYASRLGLSFPMALGGEGGKGSVFNQYKISAFPGTYLIDSNGTVLYRSAGLDMDGLKSALNKVGFQ